MNYDKTISVLKEELFQAKEKIFTIKNRDPEYIFQIFKECGTYDIRLERQLSLMRRH